MKPSKDRLRLSDLAEAEGISVEQLQAMLIRSMGASTTDAA